MKISIKTIRELIGEAGRARENAYAPYSRFKVGAALLTARGKIYRGCNAENSSFGGAICAERGAFMSAIAAGERQFKAIAIVADTEDPVPPCGICRQFISEFSKDMIVIMANTKNVYEVTTIKELMPKMFELDAK